MAYSITRLQAAELQHAYCPRKKYASLSQYQLLSWCIKLFNYSYLHGLGLI